jgi:feruloyl-CoA synthase
MLTIGEVVRMSADTFGEREALVSGDRRISFAQLAREVDGAMAWLRAQDIQRGDKVALQGRNSIPWVVACYAVVSLGAVVVPINHKLAPAETAYILGHSETCLWLVDADVYRGTAVADRPDIAVFTLDGYSLDGPTAFAPVDGARIGAGSTEALDSDALAELLYTSGTTGRPKGCMHNHANVLLAGIASSLVYGLGPADRVLLAMPAWHSFPLNNLLVGSLYVGACVVLLPEYHAQGFVQTVQDEKCTVFFGAPIAYLAPLRSLPDFDRYDLSSVRAWLYGGGPIDATTAHLLTQRYHTTGFYQVFGMTETGPTGTALWPTEQLAKAGSIGRYAVSGCVLKVMRENETPVAPGEVGEIWMRCQSMMLGYYRDEVATAAAFRDGWYRTGDLARADADGYLFIVDRLKDMVVTGGENVYSKEVEDVLAGYPSIADVAVIGEPHAEWGESVIAVVVLKDAHAFEQEAVRAYCAERLAKDKIPRRFDVMEALPRTPTGKLMKFKLRRTSG